MITIEFPPRVKLRRLTLGFELAKGTVALMLVLYVLRSIACVLFY